MNFLAALFCKGLQDQFAGVPSDLYANGADAAWNGGDRPRHHWVWTAGVPPPARCRGRSGRRPEQLPRLVGLGQGSEEAFVPVADVVVADLAD